MPDVITPMGGGTAPDKVLAKQKYDTDNIAQNMFSTAVRKGMKEMVPATVFKGVTIQRLWDAVFADDSDFLQRYHDRRKETDLNVGKWSYAADKGSGYRFVSLTTIVEVPRAGTPTPLNEAHRFAYVTVDGGKLLIVYQISSQTPNVPTGTSFRTEALCEITADSATADCSMAFWGNCRKMSMTFSMIQYVATPRAIREMTVAYQLMIGIIQEDLCGGPPATAVEAGADLGDSMTNINGTSFSGGGSDGGDGGGGGGGGGAPSSLFQGVLLVLALLMTVSLVRSMVVINRTAGQAALATQTARALGSVSGGAGALPPAASASASSPSFPMTEEQALINAARDAQLQTLRYRWVEQRSALADVQGSLGSLRWMLYTQWIAIIGIAVKVFFFS